MSSSSRRHPSVITVTTIHPSNLTSAYYVPSLYFRQQYPSGHTPVIQALYIYKSLQHSLKLYSPTLVIPACLRTSSFTILSIRDITLTLSRAHSFFFSQHLAHSKSLPIQRRLCNYSHLPTLIRI